MNVDYTFIRGDGDSITINWPGKDFTDCALFFTAKKQPDSDATDAAAVIKVDVPSSDLNGVTDKATIPLSAVKMTVQPGTYDYDIQIKKGTEDPQTLRIGKILVKADITRRTA